LDNKNTIIIRFNPDGNGGVWKKDRAGKFYINDMTIWNDMLQTLGRKIKGCVDCDIEEQLTLIYMYYSNENKIVSSKHKKIPKVVSDVGKLSCSEWRNKLSDDELKKFDAMKVLRETKETKEEKKTLTAEFYTWLYERRPDLKK
jgi:hypothetical protein